MYYLASLSFFSDSYLINCAFEWLFLTVWVLNSLSHSLWIANKLLFWDRWRNDWRLLWWIKVVFFVFGDDAAYFFTFFRCKPLIYLILFLVDVLCHVTFFHCNISLLFLCIKGSFLIGSCSSHILWRSFYLLRNSLIKLIFLNYRFTRLINVCRKSWRCSQWVSHERKQKSEEESGGEVSGREVYGGEEFEEDEEGSPQSGRKHLWRTGMGVRSKIFKVVAPLRSGTEVLGWIARCDKLACIDLLFSKFKMLWRLGIVWDSSRKVKFTLGILSCSFLFFLWSGRNSLTKSSCIK